MGTHSSRHSTLAERGQELSTATCVVASRDSSGSGDLPSATCGKDLSRPGEAPSVRQLSKVRQDDAFSARRTSEEAGPSYRVLSV